MAEINEVAEQVNQSLNDRRAELVDEYDNVKRERNELGTKLALARNKSAELQDVIGNLEDKLEVRYRESTELDSEIIDLESEDSALEQKLSDIEDELKTIKESMN